MRVIVGHNHYRAAAGPSGENLAVAQEIASLRAAGLEVRELRRSSDDLPAGALNRAQQAVAAVHSKQAVQDLLDLLDQGPADVLHLHNVYPQLSASVVSAAHRRGVAVVQTLHNYRHVCMAGTFFRDGAVCTDCSGKRITWPGLAHGCYRGSRSQSAVMLAALATRRPTWQTVDRFVALTPFMADFLVRELSVHPDRVLVRPTSVPDPGPLGDGGDDVLFVGRLDAYKGVRLLLDAWAEVRDAAGGRRLVIVGDGPESPAVAAAAERDPTIVWRGALDGGQVRDAYRSAGLVVVPSQLYEGFPRVIAEAFSYGVPVLASSLGSVGSTVPDGTGWTADPTPASFTPALRRALESGRLQDLRLGARSHFQHELHPDVALSRLVDLYRSLRATA